MLVKNQKHKILNNLSNTMSKGHAATAQINVALLERLRDNAETLLSLQKANVFDLASPKATQLQKDYRSADRLIKEVRCLKNAETYRNKLGAIPLNDEERKFREQRDQEDHYERN